MAMPLIKGIAGGTAGGLVWIVLSYLREGSVDWMGAAIFAVAFGLGWMLVSRWRGNP